MWFRASYVVQKNVVMCDIGIASGLNVMGHGTVNYTFYNNEGTLKTAIIEH
jgi:hypothetical protein